MLRSRLMTGPALTLVVGMTLLLAGTAEADRVRTDAGIVEGFRADDSSVRVFRGIPFAAPPVGERRWQPPQPVEPWEGIRDATRFGARCAQNRLFDAMVFRDDTGSLGALIQVQRADNPELFELYEASKHDFLPSPGQSGQ